VNTPEKADVIPKDPKEYIRKMKYFSNVVEKINYN
jgi:hypothetical protein